MVKPAKHFYEFGPFRVDALKRRLLRDEKIVPLTPKAFDTLLVLIENCGRVVEKDDLMEKVWPGLTVEENNLTQHVSALRKALGEQRDDPQYIMTVSGLGYRFIASVNEMWPEENKLTPTAPVRNEIVVVNEAHKGHQNGFARTATGPTTSSTPALEPAATSPERRGRVLAAAALIALTLLSGGYYFFTRTAKRAETNAALNSQIKSIAILPFKALGSEGMDEYIGLGMADALITKLSSIRQINVRPTSSILKYKNAEQDPGAAGRELAVDSVLDGRVQKSGDHIRVTVQLVRAGDGAPLWGGTFDEKNTDIFAVEDRISEEVVQALLPTITDTQKRQLTKHYTEDTEAYQAYIKGRYYWNKRTSADTRKAISYYEDAIIQDPNYALAYAGLADSYATLGILDNLPAQETMPKARSAALRALELDDGLAEAHAALAYVKHRFEWDFAGAEREFKRAIELNPEYPTAHQWYGWYLVSLSKFDNALAEFQRAQQLDPFSLYTNLTLGAPYFHARVYDKATAQYKRVIEMNPDFWLAHWWLAQTYTQQKRYDDAISEIQKVAKMRGENLEQMPAAGYIFAVSGKPVEARRVLEELQRWAKDHYISPYGMATIYAGLGENGKAFEWLERALKERDSGMVFINVDQRLDNIRSDPRFADLDREVAGSQPISADLSDRGAGASTPPPPAP